MDASDIKLNLCRKWDAFLDTRNANKEGKLSALEEFLLYFMSVYKAIDSDLQQYLRGLNGIFGILTRHFLCDVHEICSKSKNEDEEALLTYLLTGRGAIVLCALEVTGVQDISCNWELANLLLTIMAAFQSRRSHEGMSLFALGLQEALKADDVHGMMSVMQMNCGSSLAEISHYFSKEFSSNTSGEDAVDGENVAGSSFMCVSVVNRNTTLNAKHILDCVFSLLEQLCLKDIKNNPVPSISFMVLHVILDLLKTATENQFSEKAVAMHSVYIIQKMVAVTVGTSVCLLKKLVDSEALQKICLFPVVIQIVKNRLQRLEDEKEKGELLLDLDGIAIVHQEVYICMLGCLKVLHAGTHGRLSRTNYGEFTKFVNIFLKYEGSHLLVNCLTKLDPSCSTMTEIGFQQTVSSLIWMTGEIGFNLRKMRMNAYHSELGEKHCSNFLKLDYLSHHHALGNVYVGPFKHYVPSHCPVAAMTNVLLSLLTSSNCASVIQVASTALSKCGVCCCLNFKDIFQCVIATLRRINAPQLHEILLHIIENLLLAFSSCTVAFDCFVATCQQCETTLTHNQGILEKMVLTLKSASTLVNLNAQVESADFKNCFWSVLEQYFNLLLQADLASLKMLERHMFAVLTSANENLRMELYLRVFLPLLLHISDKFQESETEFNEELAQFCINAVVFLLKLPNAYIILRTIVHITNVFKLICYTSLRHAVLRLLQTVMLEETKMFENSWNYSLTEIKECEVADRSHCSSETSSSLNMFRDEESVVKLYHDTLLQHMHWFVETIGKNTSDARSINNRNEIGSVHDISAETDADPSQASHSEASELLLCIVDLWKTVCFIMDRSAAYRFAFRATHVESLIFNAIHLVIQHHHSKDSHIHGSQNVALKDTAKLELDLVGTFLHILTVCDIGNKNEEHKAEMENLVLVLHSSLEANLSKCDPQYVRDMFQALLYATLKTDVMPLNTGLLFRKPSFALNFECLDSRSIHEESSSRSPSPSLDAGYDGDNEDDDDACRTVPLPGNKVYRTESAFCDKTLSVVCPSVLNLLLDLSVAYWNIVFKMSDGSDKEKAVSNLTWVAQVLVEICKVNNANSAILVEDCKVIDTILQGYQLVLQTPDPLFSDLQDVLLFLLASCGQHKILKSELEFYIKLFMKPQIPAKKFLKALNSLIGTIKQQPVHCIQFLNSDGLPSAEIPEVQSEESSLSSVYRSSDTTKRSSKGVDIINSSLLLVKQSVINTVSQHRENCLGSCWARTSIAGCFPPPDSVPFWDGGLGISFWINVSDSSYSDISKPSYGSSEHHLFSCGTDGLLVEVWCNQDTRFLVLKLAKSSKETHSILDAKVLRIAVRSHTWQLLSVSWMSLKKNKKFILQVMVHLNLGSLLETETASLECQWSDVHQNIKHWILLLGHYESSSCLSVPWALGNLKIFRNAFVSQEAPELLNLLGPDCTQLEITTNDWNSVNNDDLQKVLEHESAMQDLQTKLLVSYMPHHGESFFWHPVMQNVEMSSYLHSLSSLSNASSSLVHLPVLKLGGYASIETHSVETALIRLGGSHVIISLFALIVDLHNDEDIQAECLSILVNCRSKSARLRSAFKKISGWDLVMKVLASPKCIISCRMLSVLVNACTSEPILIYDALDHHWKLNKLTTATVTDVKLLLLLLKNWKIFQSKKNGVFFWLLKLFELAIHEYHPKRAFNLELFTKEENVSDHLITICKEQVLEEDEDTFSSRICHTVIHILKSLVGKEPDILSVKKFIDFLTALHPPGKTYVCHARSSFYFLPTKSKSSVITKFSKSPGLKVASSFSQASYFSKMSKQSKSVTNETLKQLEVKSKQEIEFCANDESKLHSDKRSFSHDDIYRSEAWLAASITDVHCDPSETAGSCSEGFLTAVSSSSSLQEFGASADTSQVSVETLSPHSTELVMEESIKTIMNVEGLSLENDSYGIVSGTENETPSRRNDYFDKNSKTHENEMNGNQPAALKENCHYDENMLPSGFEYSTSSANWGIILQGVLEIINMMFRSSSTQYISQLLDVVDPQVLVVLALHPFDGVRTETMKVIRLYFEHADEEHAISFLKRNMFNLLANQVYQYEADTALVETCIGIFLGKEFSFETWLSSTFDGCLWNFAAIPVILSVLPRTHHNESLCHDLLAFLQKLCRMYPVLFHEFVNAGLIQSLCLTIAATVHSPLRSQETDWELKDHLVLGDVSTFLSDVMMYFIQLSGSHNSHLVCDLLTLLSYYEQLEIEHCGNGSACVKGFRNCHCSCLFNGLRTIQSHFEWHDEQLIRLMNVENTKRSVKFGSSSEKSASSSELKERMKDLLQKAVDFLLFADVTSDELFISSYEKAFSRFLFHLVLDGSMAVLNKRQSVTRLKWHSLVYATHDTFRVQLGRLLVFMLSPTQPLGQKLFIIELLVSKHRHKDLVHYVLKSNNQLEKKFFLFLDCLLHDNFENIANAEVVKCLALQNSLRKSTGHLDGTPSSIRKQAWIEESVKSKRLWAQMHIFHVHKIFQKLEMLTKSLEKSAVEVTCAVVDRQNQQRQIILAHVKRQFSDRLRTDQYWQMIIKQLTHERAVWYSPDSYPQSWELDTTEGPHRVRKRLARCQLTINERFLLPEYRNKLKAAAEPKRFSFLFQHDDNSSNLATIKDHLHNAEKIRCTYRCVIVAPSTEANGELLLGNHCVYYIGEESSSLKIELNDGKGNRSDVVSYTWYFNDIKEVMKRRFQLQDNALELFLVYGQTFLIAFPSSQDRNTLYDQLMASNLMNLLCESGNLTAYTQMWRDRMITNFEYLTQLNKIAGRSFNDLMQYPVFPFVLADYCSSVLKLSCPKSYRNLSRPMAVQDENREQRYINQYLFLQKEQAESQLEDYLMPALGPYHYGSHYSNSGIVLHFLVRLPPFTSMFLSYQDNNFDIPDRTFHSMHTSWRLSSVESTTDVKELIPEFFFLPEMLMNSEGFDFGIRQSGDIVNDVILPPWCRNDPRLFILINRQALESSYVTEQLHNWIDLVFGYKQTGQPAVDAINVFHPATYYGFDVEQIKDPLRQNAMYTMIKTFGQTPCMLFRYAHPMISLSLNRQQLQTQPIRVMQEVQGLSWGSYVGSPEEPDPTMIWRKRHANVIGSFVPMVTNEVFGLSKKAALLVQYCKDKGASMINTTYVTCAALVHYGSPDGVVRLQQRRDRPSQAVIAIDIADPVTCCATAPDCTLLFLGKSSGNITVYEAVFEPSKLAILPEVKFCEKPTELYGHKNSVVDIHLCKSFSVAVSASTDSTCIIWDLNRLSYVRSIGDHKNEVHLVQVSETSGDIVSVSNEETGKGSCLMLHTINAKLVGSVTTTEVIHSVCFSNATEGISVNVICAGLSDGSICMWSTWDLLPLRQMHFTKFFHPVVCIAYSLDCQHLYAANADGVVIICASQTKNSAAASPKFRTLI